MLTSGDVKSLLGLDDITLNTGTRNFETMRTLCTDLSRVAGATMDEHAADQEIIDNVEVFHKTDFMRQLGSGTEHCCGCLDCGLYCEEDKTECTVTHGPCCTDCESGFNIFVRLRTLRQRASEKPNLSKLERDDIDEMKFQIDDVEQNYRAFRSHQVRTVPTFLRGFTVFLINTANIDKI